MKKILFIFIACLLPLTSYASSLVWAYDVNVVEVKRFYGGGYSRLQVTFDQAPPVTGCPATDNGVSGGWAAGRWANNNDYKLIDTFLSMLMAAKLSGRKVDLQLDKRKCSRDVGVKLIGVNLK